MKIVSVANPVYSSADNSSIDCEATFDNGITYPYTAKANDPMDYGKKLWDDLKAGGYGVIAPYIN